jgi:CBS domain-containing protein
MTVEQLMTSEVTTVLPETPLKEVARLLIERGISGAPVCDEQGEILGIVSVKDLKDEARTAAEAMTAPVVTIAYGRSVAAAARLMIEHDITRLPVLRQNKIAGILTRSDLVRAYARDDAEIADEIRDAVLLGTLWLEPGAVQVEVEDGRVAVTGEVETECDAALLRTLVKRVPGVIEVRYDVTHRFAEETPAERFAGVGSER